jgi:hypothetical protein
MGNIIDFHRKKFDNKSLALSGLIELVLGSDQVLESDKIILYPQQLLKLKTYR